MQHRFQAVKRQSQVEDSHGWLDHEYRKLPAHALTEVTDTE